MADYAISNVPRRVVYAASGTGPYAFTFEILDETDIAVYKASTLLTLTTDYTVTIDTDGTGSVTLVSTAGTSNITIVGSKNIQRTTDFTTGGDLFANTLNDELDNQTIFVQQVAETAERGLKAPVTDPTDIAMTLPAKASRAGKTLAFDANGNPVVGEDIGNWRGDWTSGTSYTVRDLVKDGSNSSVYRCNTAHTASGTTPISSNTDSAKWDLVIDGTAVADAEAAQAAAEAAQDAAETAETNAETAATNAASSASAASTSATNAASSASSASSSASSASSSASAASTSATNASTSASSASTYATNASNSASSASTSASSASSSASAASTSASNASTSATNAASSATAASGSASTASTQATNAASSASAASTSATNASSSASAASTSATNAASSATSAASSATAAAASAAEAANKVAKTSDTGSAVLPKGTTAERDGTPLSGYFRFNTTTGQAEMYNGSAWGSVGGGATGAGGDAVFQENGTTVTTNYTLTSSKNAMSVGPITVNSGVSVTVPSGARWVVL